MRYFEPPTLKRQASDHPFWGRYKTHYALSVVWDGSQFVDTSVPMTDDLAKLKDGETYFLGGHVYYVTDAVADTLHASGYPTYEGPPDPDPGPGPDPIDPPGFGEGGYGEGGYGT